VAVGGVDRDGVDAHRHERLDPVFDVVADAARGGAAESALVVARGVGVNYFLQPFLCPAPLQCRKSSGK
jgi:hypothetical protein